MEERGESFRNLIQLFTPSNHRTSKQSTKDTTIWIEKIQDKVLHRPPLHVHHRSMVSSTKKPLACAWSFCEPDSLKCLLHFFSFRTQTCFIYQKGLLCKIPRVYHTQNTSIVGGQNGHIGPHLSSLHIQYTFLRNICIRIPVLNNWYGCLTHDSHFICTPAAWSPVCREKVCSTVKTWKDTSYSAILSCKQFLGSWLMEEQGWYLRFISETYI